jgi:hypothetical protein
MGAKLATLWLLAFDRNRLAPKTGQFGQSECEHLHRLAQRPAQKGSPIRLLGPAEFCQICKQTERLLSIDRMEDAGKFDDRSRWALA